MCSIERELDITRQKKDILHKKYVEITSDMADYIAGSDVPVSRLRCAVTILPPPLKKEHMLFVEEAEDKIDEVKSNAKIVRFVGRHGDYLNYSLVKYLIDLYGNEKLKHEVADYAIAVKTFREETQLEVFSEICDDQPDKINGRFSKMVTKHDKDWATATLEDVERFRIEFCRELSLYNFSLNLLRVSRGCVEITWRVPRSLVAYIQKSIKPSSLAMKEHHVTSLTIDGFIAYDSTTGSLSLYIYYTPHCLLCVSYIPSHIAMQNEYKVIRLEQHTIDVHYSSMLSEISPDVLLPYLVDRRLLSSTEAANVNEMSSQSKKILAILEALNERNIVGVLPTFCASLKSAQQPDIAERLSNSEYINNNYIHTYILIFCYCVEVS